MVRKSYGGLTHPKKDLLIVAEIIEKLWYILECRDELSLPDIHNVIEANVFYNLSVGNYSGLDNFTHHDKEFSSHKYDLLKLFIQGYLKTKFFYLGKCQTINEHIDFVRHSLTKLILFKGQ